MYILRRSTPLYRLRGGCAFILCAQEQLIKSVFQSRTRRLLFSRGDLLLPLLLRQSSLSSTTLPTFSKLFQRPRQVPRLNSTHILSQNRNPLLRTILFRDNSIAALELIPALQESSLVRHLWYPRLAGPQTTRFDSRLPELLAEPAVPLPSCAAGHQADAIDVSGVSGGVRALIVARTALADR